MTRALPRKKENGEVDMRPAYRHECGNTGAILALQQGNRVGAALWRLPASLIAARHGPPDRPAQGNMLLSGQPLILEGPRRGA